MCLDAHAWWPSVCASQWPRGTREPRGLFLGQVGERPAPPPDVFAAYAAHCRRRGARAHRRTIGHGVTMNESTGSLRRCLAQATVLLLAACAATGDDNRWSRHGDSGIWTAAAAAQLDHPAQLVPELTLL